MHWIGEEHFQRVSFATWLSFQTTEKINKSVKFCKHKGVVGVKDLTKDSACTQ